ncbi:UNVERIFIED_ORG: hypothetical protein LHJ69_16040 [Shinella sp. XGS7]|nr:MBL fold metallo-hydrolase [Shinella sp. XGS7]
MVTPRARIRTYRHGLGDCHLVTLFGKNKATYKILIDCGVILGTPDAKALMTRVMDDVRDASGGRVDLLVATHEHWDHVSGFAQAAESFSKLEVGEVWMAWTEDPKDDQARELLAAKGNALAALRGASLHLNTGLGATEPALFESLAEFFGMAAGPTTKDALEAVRARAGNGGPRYCDPSDAPVELPGVGARIYVLGPPRDMALLKRVNPRKGKDESYDDALKAFGASVEPALKGGDDQAPFAAIDGLPLNDASKFEFFRHHYFDGPGWRRIDSDWMLAADELALALDNMTNNTSLVLAIELVGKDVLLFAADAQVGNWLSWPDHKWTVNGKQVTGEDLLRRTTVYKVGHHGSHNATLKARGLELMDSLQVAVIPVDHDMALKKKWGAMPLVGLIDALDAKTGSKGVVARTDQDLPKGARAAGVSATDEYFEISV